jgi:hypothetical protein
MRVRRWVKKTTTTIGVAALCLGLVACGGDTTNITLGDGTGQQEQEDRTNQTPQVQIVNNNVVQNINQNNQARIRGDEVRFRVRVRQVNVQRAPRTVIYKQYIHINNSCRIDTGDLNNDGYIDEIEIRQVCGNVLLALDGNPEQEEEDVNSYPKASGQNGSYQYTQTASLSRLEAQARAPEREEDPKYHQLAPDEELNLGERILVIYGLFEAQEYPETVARSEEDPTKVALPISWEPVQVDEEAPAQDEQAEQQQPEEQQPQPAEPQGQDFQATEEE